jgi:hypothetical protein
MGQGGMGQVWRARHPSGEVVAIKVLRHGVNDTSRLAMQREIASMAGLSHPHIAEVVDTGTVPDEAEGLPTGSPWVAMELAEGGSLLEGYRSLRSIHIQRLLRQVLRALAHAHARGVLHRDLKPSNVLLAGDGGARLVDFGLVLRMDDLDPDAPSGGGTPSYMAPEQADPTFAPMGPWTDLYSLGIVAWVLTTGRRPFESKDARQQMRNHIELPLPAYVPRRAIPPGFEHWLARMLAKRPEDRFQRAADALASLVSLGRPEHRPIDGYPTDPPMDVVRVTVPSTPPRPSPRVHSRLPRGLGVLSMREPPLVGRSEAQGILWTQLLAMLEHRTPRLALLRGPTGVGKTRLATWLGRAAHATGAAQVLAIRPDTTFDGLIRTTLAPGTHELEPVNAWSRRHGLRHDEARLLRVVAAGKPVARAEALTALLLLLRGLAADRPVVAHIDDVHDNPVGLPLVQALASGAEALPVLALLTAPDHVLATDEATDALWDELAAHEASVEIALPPLSPSDGVQLLRSVVHLDPTLESQLVRRTEGNPLFALEVVRSWAQAGRLRPTERGVALVGAPGALPRTVTDAARERLERFVADRDDWSVALERAALLGSEVDSGEWQRATEGVPPDLMPALLVHRLAVPSPAWRGLRWRFAHGMLGEVLRDRALVSGRLRAHHRAIAAALADESPQRLAPHLQGAGDRLGAGRAWLQVAHDRLGELRVAEALLAAREADEQLGLAGRPDTDPERLMATVLAANCLHMQGHDADQLQLLTQVVTRADPTTAAYREALLGLGTRAGWLGDEEGFRHWLAEAYEHARVAGDTQRMGRCRERLARFESMSGHHERAVQLAREVLDSGWDEGMARRTAVIVAGRAGDLQASRRHAEAGAAVLSREGRFGGRSSLMNDLASVLLAGGDAEGAAEALARAEADARTSGSTHTLTYVLANAAVQATRSGAHAKAADRLSEAITMCRDPRLSALLSAVSLLPLARLRRWRDFDHAAEHALTLVSTLGDDDAPELVRQAVAVADRAGEKQRAAVARDVLAHLHALAGEGGPDPG